MSNVFSYVVTWFHPGDLTRRGVFQVAATRQAAWEREAQEAQRALELERQAVREQAKEARELADRERSALQEAARKSGRFHPRRECVPRAYPHRSQFGWWTCHVKG